MNRVARLCLLILATAIPSAYLIYYARPTRTPANDLDTCIPIRLDRVQADGTPGSMQGVPVHDQGPFGICYAEAAVQMVDAYRFSVLKQNPADGVQSAVMSAAIGENFSTGRPAYAGGYVTDVLQYIKANGFHDAYKVTHCILKQETKPAFQALQRLYDDYQSKLQSKLLELGSLKPPPTPEVTADAIKMATAGLQWESYQEARSWFASQSIALHDQMTPEVYAYLLGLKVTRFVWGLLTYPCFATDPAIPVALPASHEEGTAQTTPAELGQKIDALLGAPNAQPVAIAYCRQLLLVGRAYAGATKEPITSCATITGTPADASDIHDSLVIGRRRDPVTARCQYLARNSWGTSCQTTPIPLMLPPALLKDPEIQLHDPEFQAKPLYSADWTCEKGNIWIDADSLLKSAFTISHF